MNPQRWNSYIKGKGFENNAGMNSFNHYAFGSVNEWLFGNAAGIKVEDAGYRTFTIKPEIAKEGISYVKAKYHSINGEIVSSWKKTGNSIVIEISVPPNTKANLFIPNNDSSKVTENNKPLKGNPDIIEKGTSQGFLNVEIGSGNYQFISEN